MSWRPGPDSWGTLRVERANNCQASYHSTSECQRSSHISIVLLGRPTN